MWALTGYRDAIRHVVAEFVEGINAGLDPVTIAANLRLPERLAQKPYLQAFYGQIGYAARDYFREPWDGLTEIRRAWGNSLPLCRSRQIHLAG